MTKLLLRRSLLHILISLIFSALPKQYLLRQLLTAFLSLTLLSASAQQVDWIDSGVGASYDVGSGITSDGAGNSYVIGTVLQTAVNNARFGNDSIRPGENRSCEGWLAKYTLQGNREWLTSVEGTGADLGTDIELDSDTSFVAVGLYTGSVPDFDAITEPAGAGVKLIL